MTSSNDDQTSAGASTPPSAEWKALFAGSPREVLARLTKVDALELGARCTATIERQAVLVDAMRLQYRALAHIARDGAAYRGSPALDIWIAERVRRSLKECLEEDRIAHRSGLPAQIEGDPLFEFLANTLGVPSEHLRRGILQFNSAPFEARSAFFALVVARKDIVQFAAENHVSVPRSKAAFLRALRALGVREELGGRDLDEGGAV